jgi:hypothetical protein
MAAVPPAFSQIYGDPALWASPSPDYNLLTARFGPGVAPAAATTAADCRTGLAQTCALSPVVVAFVADAECDAIYVAHSLTVYPADLADPTPLDGLLVGLVGDVPASTVPVVLPQTFLTCTAATLAHTVAELQVHHGAAPPVFRTGPHAVGSANTSDVVARPAMVLPPDLAAAALQGAPHDGRYTLLGFYNNFLQTALGGTPAEIARIQPLAEWWRLASTDVVAAGPTVVARALLATGTPRLQAKLANWSGRVSASQLARLGVGGPGLTNASFALGIAEIRATLEGNHIAALEFERAKNDKTFTDVHGAQLAQVLHRLCNVASDADLPPVHLMLLKTSKSRTYGALQGLFTERSAASSVPLEPTFAPLATTKLVEDVFRTYQPGTDGLTFAKGLSPFAIVCPGHEDAMEVARRITEATAIEGGASVSLADASALVATDVRFPQTAYAAMEKLYGWSVVVDVFHGVNHPVAVNLRRAVVEIGPRIQRLAESMGDSQAGGMDRVCRVMYDMQQDYFLYINKLAAGTPCLAPDFASIVDAVASYRVEGLSPLPQAWYLLATSPARAGGAIAPAPRTAPAAMRAASTAPTVNPHADARLVQRYKDGNFASVTSMVGSRNLPFPKHSGKEVCMIWALKGACNAGCKRAALHVRYGAATNKALHQFLTDCGVPDTQP